MTAPLESTSAPPVLAVGTFDWIMSGRLRPSPAATRSPRALTTPRLTSGLPGRSATQAMAMAGSPSTTSSSSARTAAFILVRATRTTATSLVESVPRSLAGSVVPSDSCTVMRVAPCTFSAVVRM